MRRERGRLYGMCIGLGINLYLRRFCLMFYNFTQLFLLFSQPASKTDPVSPTLALRDETMRVLRNWVRALHTVKNLLLELHF